MRGARGCATSSRRRGRSPQQQTRGAGNRAAASGRGLGPDGDDAAAGVAPDELARCFGRAAVDLDALDVLRWCVAREVGRRLRTVEEVLRVTPWRRADHLGDAVVREADLLHPAYGDEDVDQGGGPRALDLLLRDEVAHARVAPPLEVGEPPADRARGRLDDHAGQLVGRLQLEDVLERLSLPQSDVPHPRGVPDRTDLERVLPRLARQLKPAGRVRCDGVVRIDDHPGRWDGIPGGPGYDLAVEHAPAALLGRDDRRCGYARGEEEPWGGPTRGWKGPSV